MFASQGTLAEAAMTPFQPVTPMLASPEETAEAIFGRWKVWLIRKNVVVMAVLLLVFGFLLIASGAGILLRCALAIRPGR